MGSFGLGRYHKETDNLLTSCHTQHNLRQNIQSDTTNSSPFRKLL